MTNPQDTQSQAESSPWHRLLDRQLTRRGALGTVAATAAAATLPLTISEAGAVSNNGAPVAADPTTLNPRTLPPFRAIEPGNADTITLPFGYRWQTLAPWGEVFTADGREIGFNHDFVGYFPVDMLEGGRSSTDALLTINHEYANALFVGGNTKDRTKEQIEAEMRSVGVRARYEALLEALDDFLGPPAPLLAYTRPTGEAWCRSLPEGERAIAAELLTAFRAYLREWGWLDSVRPVNRPD